MHMKASVKVFAALASAFAPGAVFACASCGCSINSDWSVQGLSSASGWSLDVRYDYLNQNQLRSGTKKISAVAAANSVNSATGGPAEVEQFTRNNYLTASLDYNDGKSWGVNFVLPYIDRTHSTLGTGSDGSTFDPANGAYGSSGSGIGDMRVLGRYFGFTDQRNFGIQFGLKLPTGKTDQVSNFGNPQPVDPGLQRGTGTTDAILGAYYFDNLGADWDYFALVIGQVAANQSEMAGGTYRPGNNAIANLGVRYHGFESVIPTLQLNARHAAIDSGAAADAFATGGTVAYLTPGAIFLASEKTAVYTNVQLPVYQKLNGIQLAPKFIFSVGARFAF
jgi:hypothetical protein